MSHVLVCPKCRGSMTAVSEILNHVFRCDGCSGLWFEMVEHERRRDDADVIDIGNAAIGAAHNENDHVSCPVCVPAQSLIRMVDPDQPHIEFESCHECFGRYYDAGEFRDASDLTLREFFFDRREQARD